MAHVHQPHLEHHPSNVGEGHHGGHHKPVRNQSRIQRLQRTACSAYAFIFLGAIIFFAGLCAMVALAQDIVNPYYDNKLYEFDPGECNITSVKIKNPELPCSCPDKVTSKRVGSWSKSSRKKKTHHKCDSTFPCYVVIVEYKAEDAEGGFNSNDEAMIHPNIKNLQESDECSFYSCLEEVEENQKMVERWLKPYKTRYENIEQFSCFFGTEEKEGKVLHECIRKSAVIHSIFWPVLFMVLGLILFGVGAGRRIRTHFRRRKRRRKHKKHEPASGEHSDHEKHGHHHKKKDAEESSKVEKKDRGEEG